MDTGYVLGFSDHTFADFFFEDLTPLSRTSSTAEERPRRAEISELGVEPSRAIILNSKPVEVQISLFNKFQQKFDDQQVRGTLHSLAEPFSDIKPGWGTPRIESTEVNLEFVT